MRCRYAKKALLIYADSEPPERSDLRAVWSSFFIKYGNIDLSADSEALISDCGDARVDLTLHLPHAQRAFSRDLSHINYFSNYNNYYVYKLFKAWIPHEFHIQFTLE